LLYSVLDISRIPDDSLATEPFLQSVLGLLKYKCSRDSKDKLEFLLRCLLESGDGELHLGHLKAVVVYISAVSPSIPVEVLEMKIEKMFPMRYEPGSIADQFTKQGRMQGIEEGRQEGLIEGIKEGRLEGMQKGLLKGMLKGMFKGMQQGMKAGIREGRRKGEIHLIQTLQEILGLPVSDGATLEDRSLEQLQAITGELRNQFRDRK
jgi:hypothetical protein